MLTDRDLQGLGSTVLPLRFNSMLQTLATARRHEHVYTHGSEKNGAAAAAGCLCSLYEELIEGSRLKVENIFPFHILFLF